MHNRAILSQVFPCSHKGPESFWSNNATIEDWFDEFVGQANIINRFGGVRMEDLWGKMSDSPPSPFGII